MTDSDEWTRRNVLRRSGGAAFGVGGVAGGSGDVAGVGNVLDIVDDATTDESDDAEVLDFEQIPRLEIRNGVETVPASAIPESASGIRPGSQLLVEREAGVAGCSANFVWRDRNDGTLYLGTAGHCFLRESPASRELAEEQGDDVSQVSTSVCTSCTFGGLTGQTLLRGEPVELGDVVYARQEEPGGGEGVGNDFGLVEIPADVEHLVDPSMPQFGGPTGEYEGVVPGGDPIVQYGAGVVNGETYLTQASRGVSLGAGPDEGSWIAGIRATPGDSGSGLSAATGILSYGGGPAAGVLTHVTSAGVAGTTIDRCKEMVAEDGLSLDLEVVTP